MTKYGMNIISVIFLIYGTVRLGVSSLLLLQLSEFLQIAALQEALNEVSTFLTTKQTSALIAVNVLGYLSYLWIMGALLVAGAIGLFQRKLIGQHTITIFLVLYVLLFVNFQTINPKVMHLIVCAILLGVYMQLRNKDATKNNIEG